MKRVFIALGSNLGDRETHLDGAVKAISQLAGCRIVARSPIYETEPLGVVEQPPFLNAVIEIETAIPAETLLQQLLMIEKQHGRQRREKWGPRTLDLDILLFGDQMIRTETLTVPHPRMAERRFVLVPLADLVPELQVPGSKKTVAALLQECPDRSHVWRFNPRRITWPNSSPY